MNATSADTRPVRFGWLDWLRRELAPSRERKVRTLILVCGSVLCVIISMALQVPQLAVSVYMVFFISKENKTLTTVVGVLGLVGLTIGIVISLLLYKLTYGYPELRVPSMAIILFLGMYASRVLVIGPLGFLLGFIIAITQSIGELVPSPELLVRVTLWLWVALAYSIALTVVLNAIFLPKPTGVAHPKPKSLFVPDAFTNPAHFRFALKVTCAAMICYLFYTGVDWFGIHTAFVTCVFIALESTGATLRKGVLRAVGCIIGGFAALLTIIFLIPHMETITSLVILVAGFAAIAGWVSTGSERISYAGLQMAFAFYYSLFPGVNGFAPDTDLHNVRDRVVGILLGLAVTGFVFHYIWPEWAVDRLQGILRQASRQLERLLAIPGLETPLPEARPKAEALIAEILRNINQAQREAELARFEMDEPRARETVSPVQMENTISRMKQILSLATSLTSDSVWQEWQQMSSEAKASESELRKAVARRMASAANSDDATETNADLSGALARWTETVRRFSLEGSRTALLSQIATEAQKI